MHIIEIKALENGAHDNQNGEHLNFIPSGWAMIPEDMPIPSSYPFVDIEVEGNVVVSMTEREVPVVEEPPTPKQPTLEERIAELELMLATLKQEVE